MNEHKYNISIHLKLWDPLASTPLENRSVLRRKFYTLVPQGDEVGSSKEHCPLTSNFDAKNQGVE